MGVKITKPLLDNGGRVSPQSRFEAYLQDEMLGTGKGKNVPTLDDTVTDIIRSRTGSKAQNTINKKAEFVVDELIYPGNRADPPIGQYVYVFSFDRHGTVLVEALCGETGWDKDESSQGGTVEWYYRLQHDAPSDDPDFENPLTPKSRNVRKSAVVLPVKDLVEGEKIGFFISPIHLTLAARKIVRKNMGSGKTLVDHGCVVRPVWGAARGYVAVPEPTKWAEAAHTHWFLPELEKFNTWKADSDQDIFVASVLENWRKPMSLNSELWPSGNVRKYAKKKKEDRLAAKTAQLDAASVYTLSIVDSHEHHAVDTATGDDLNALVWSMSHWSKVLVGVVATKQGRKFVHQLAQGLGFGKERLPYRLIAKDNWPSAFTFAEGRYLAIALNDAATVILPYTKIVGQSHGAGFIKRISGLLAPIKSGLPIPASTDLQFRVPSHWRNRYTDISATWLAPSLVILEVANVAKTYQDWKKSNQIGYLGLIEDIKMIGSFADLGNALTASVEALAKSAPKGLQRLGGAFMIGGSVGDVFEFTGTAAKGFAEEDWSSWAGASMATVGATVNTVAGAATLWSAAMPTIFVAAPYLIAVGGILILLGSLMSTTDTPYEEFAERSRFGKKYPARIYTHRGYKHTHDHEILHRKWAHHGLGTRDRTDELQTLIGMMCAFSAGYGYDETYGMGAGLLIDAGWVPPTSHFEIRFRKSGSKWKYLKVNASTYNYTDAGFTLDIKKDKNKIIQSVSVQTSTQYAEAGVRLVLQPRKFQVPAPNGYWLKVKLSQGFRKSVNSFQEGEYVS